ncbi:MAG: ATP-binding cassette domain-containing protein, partial [Candidatus Bathyarchaeia archaeon]
MKTLATRGLMKKFKGKIVVDRVDLEINPSEIVGLLGPNGAGKTTIFYMII